MSTTKTTQKTLTHESDDHTDIDLNEIVAQTVPVGDELPDFDEFNAVCKATKGTLERVIDQEAGL